MSAGISAWHPMGRSPSAKAWGLFSGPRFRVPFAGGPFDGNAPWKAPQIGFGAIMRSSKAASLRDRPGLERAVAGFRGPRGGESWGARGAPRRRLALDAEGPRYSNFAEPRDAAPRGLRRWRHTERTAGPPGRPRARAPASTASPSSSSGPGSARPTLPVGGPTTSRRTDKPATFQAIPTVAMEPHPPWNGVIPVI